MASIYRHEVINPLSTLTSSLENEDFDVLGVWELEEQRRHEVEEVTSIIGDAYDKLDAGEPLESVEDEVKQLSGYSGEFSGEVGEQIDLLAEVSDCIAMYMDNFSEDETMEVEEVMGPLEEYSETEILYNQNQDAEINGDPGLLLVSNTIGANGLRHGKEAENYQMWAEVQEENEEYRIDFWDNGTGLPEKYEPGQIFEKGIGENTGRGLYLAKEIVEEFDGTLEYSDRLAQRENGFGLEMRLKKS